MADRLAILLGLLVVLLLAIFWSVRTLYRWLAAHANDYDTPRSASAYGASTNDREGQALAEASARAAVLAVGHDCTPGSYYTYVHTTSPYGSTLVWKSTHYAMCVD